jgi:hypothetical protein
MRLGLLGSSRYFVAPRASNKRHADRVGPSHVNLVVQSEDDHVVALDEGELLFIDGIVFEECGVVQVVIERRFVRNDQILVAAGGFAEDVHRIEEGCGDTSDGCAGVASLDGVHSVGRRRRGIVPLNFLDGVGCGDRFL